MKSAAETFRFFHGQKILVTGDTGFKGSWLCMWLANLGAEVTGFSLPAEPHQILALKNQDAGLLNHVDGDVRDEKSLETIFANVEPDIVFHLAAQALVLKSYHEPRSTFATNLMGSVNILEAVKNSESVKALIYITSDKCYRNKELSRGYHENDELGGKDPYSASKACAEIAFNAYKESFFKFKPNPGVASVRAGNVIGGGDRSADRILPDTISALEKKKPVILRNPNAVRPWQHVLDPLYGYMRLASELADNPKTFSSSWNFGPENNSIQTVGDLANIVIEKWGDGEVEHQIRADAPFESNLLYLSSEKAHQELNWRALWNFERAAQESSFWYRQVFDGEDPLEVSQKQIFSYMGEVNEQ